MASTKVSTPPTLIVGDALVILVVTWIGFLSHGETLASPRWLTTFIPVSVAWALEAPWLRVYRPEIYCNPRQIWRVPLAMLLAAPLAGVLRGVMLDSPVLPLFVGVMGLTWAGGMTIWRLLYLIVANRAGRHG